MNRFLKNFIGISLTGIVIAYLSIGFVKLTIDFTQWTEETRGSFICFVVIWLPVSQLIASTREL